MGCGCKGEQTDKSKQSNVGKKSSVLTQDQRDRRTANLRTKLMSLSKTKK